MVQLSLLCQWYLTKLAGEIFLGTRLCWLYFGRENQLWVKFLAEYFRHKPSHLNIKKRQSFDKNLHSKAAKGLNSWHPYIKGQSLLSRGGGNIFTRWLRASSTLTWSWTRALKLETRPHLFGWILVNCPTQPTCIAHCDLCICQLSRRWQPSLALSKMFEPSHRPWCGIWVDFFCKICILDV